MHVLRLIPCTDPTEEMPGQLLVAQRGRRGQIDAAIACRIEGRSDGRTLSMLAVRSRVHMLYIVTDHEHILTHKFGAIRPSLMLLLELPLNFAKFNGASAGRVAFAMAVHCRCWHFEVTDICST